MASDPLRTLKDGTPCWCVDSQLPDHSPRCATQRAFAGVKGQPSWLQASVQAQGTAQTNTRARVDALKRAFLGVYSTTGIIGTTCTEVGINRNTVDNWRKADAQFAADMLVAEDHAVDLLEREAVRRAREGWDEPVFQGGREVGVVRKYSDQLIQLLLKGNRPRKYRDAIRAEVSGPEGGPIVQQVLGSMDDHERQTLRRVLEEAIAAQEALDAAPGSTEVSENASPILAGDG